MADTKKTGTFKGKSNKLGQGGRAAQLKAQGVPGAVIGAIARAKGAAPGQPNFHRKAKRATDDPNKNDADKVKQDEEAQVTSKTRKRKAKRPIEQQPQALALEKEPDVVATPNGKKVAEGFRKRKAHRGSVKKRGTLASVGSNFTKNVGNGLAKATSWPRGVNNVSLNKSGTVGTEPISKGNSKFTEVKAGPAAIDIPMGSLKRKRQSMPQRRNHRSMSGMDMLNKATKRK